MLIQIHDGDSSDSPLFPDQPHLHRGSWYRPVIASSRHTVFMTFVPTKPKSKNYIGFKATIWKAKGNPGHFLYPY